MKLPEGVSTRDGAAAMLQGMTAHYLACSTYPLEARQTRAWCTPEPAASACC